MQLWNNIPQARVFSVPDGAAGTRTVLKEMARIVRWAKLQPEMRMTAQRILSGLPGKAWLAEARQIFSWVQDNVRYQLDTNNVETLQSPDVTIAEGSGDCDDFCIVLATLLECAGHPCRFVALAFHEEGEFEHVILQTRLPERNRWLSLDATEQNGPGWHPPGAVDQMVQDI